MKKALPGEGTQSRDEPLFTADLNSLLHWRKRWGLWHEAKNSRSRAGDKDEWLPETQSKAEECKETSACLWRLSRRPIGRSQQLLGRTRARGSALRAPCSHLRCVFKRFSTPEKLGLPQGQGREFPHNLIKQKDTTSHRLSNAFKALGKMTIQKAH